MSGINKVILIGSLGRDPEIRYMPNGNAVCNFSMATSETWKDKNTGEKQESTEWHNVTIFGKLAEVAGKYLTKGSKVYIEGKLKTDKWDKEGQTHYTTKVIANVMQMLGGGEQQSNGPGPANNQANQRSASTNQAPVPQSTPQPAPAGDFDDDIPF